MKIIFHTFFYLLFAFSLNAQLAGTVSSHAKISDTAGNFTGQLDDVDNFSRDVVNIGDLNGDGIEDIAVGANLDDDGGTDKGAVWILFMNTNGTVNSHQKISTTSGGFTGNIDRGFGTSVALVGDLNGDGVQEIAVGEVYSTDGAFQAGAVWILFMNSNGTVSSHQKISATNGNLNVVLNLNGRFGTDISGIGDIDSDGIPDIVVSQVFSDNGGWQVGAVWVIRLNANGTVKARQNIGAGTGGFTGVLDVNDNFGITVSSAGDFDNDGITDILVGTRFDDDGGTDRGAVWLIYLNANGTVKANFKISDTQGNFTGGLTDNYRFGLAVESIGDIDGDNVFDFAVGTETDNDGGANRGAIWILFMNANGTVKGHQKISDTQGNFTGQLDDDDYFGGWGISVLNDLNNDGIKDLAVCAVGDDDGGNRRGAVWILFLNCPFQALPNVYASIDIGNDTTLCANETLQLNATTTQATDYLWQDGSTSSTFNVTQPGIYYVTASNACNVGTDTINVQYTTSQLAVNLGVDTVLCTGQNLILDATNATALNYLWQDGSTNSTFTVTQSGTYIVTVQDSCYSVSDTINVVLINDIPNIDLGNDTTLCANETLQLNATTTQATDYLWQDGSTNSTFNVNQAGTYYVSVANVCDATSDTINVQYFVSQLAVNLGIDTVLCTGQSLILDATNATALNYLWQDGSTNSNFIVTQSGIYFVAVSDTCVTIIDTINVIFTGDFPMPNLGNDTVLCQGDELILDGFSPIANTYLWNNGSTNSTLTVNSGGQYIVTATNNCGSTNDTINIQLIISELAIDLGNDTTLCNGDELRLEAFNATALSYEWQDGSTNDNFLVTQTGMYQVTATDFCTVLSDSIFIEYITLSVNLGNDTVICEGRAIMLDAEHPNAESYLWQNGSTNPYFGVGMAGAYFVTVENHCETVSDTIEVVISTQTPLIPNLGLNRVLCPGATEILDATTENALTYVWQDSTEGAIYIVTEPGIYEVTVSNACLSLTDDIEFTADACCNLFMPDAFTPNDDGINDVFHAFTNCQINDFSMMIYDRWGGKIFETTEINNGWDGTTSGQSLNTGVYVYVLSFNDGFSNRKMNGSFTLIR